MSDSTASLVKKIDSAGDLQSVVRTMKALAASSITQYENSVRALADYYRTVELGLSACFRLSEQTGVEAAGQTDTGELGAIVFGSDQGLVGQFNDIIADYVITTLTALPGKPKVWAVGDRIRARLADAGLEIAGAFAVPSSVGGIAPLVGRIQIKSEENRAGSSYSRVYVFHNRPKTGTLYEPVAQRLLPLDATWQKSLVEVPWPNKNLPEVMCGTTSSLRALIREYLFISIFRACAESLASENASRLAAMQRADKNINDLLDDLHVTYHRLRQGGIDEELFDVVSGFEALTPQKHA